MTDDDWLPELPQIIRPYGYGKYDIIEPEVPSRRWPMIVFGASALMAVALIVILVGAIVLTEMDVRDDGDSDPIDDDIHPTH